MPLVKCSVEEAAGKLASGPLGIGERHDYPKARAFLLNLIEQKLVKVLFLEIPKDTGKYCDMLLATATLAKQGGRPLEELDPFLLQLDGPTYSRNQIPFSKLIREAMAKGVRIVFADKATNPRYAANPASMAIRNIAAEKVFNEAYYTAGNPAGAGCVILFGAEHFASDDKALTNMIGDNISLTLHWVDLSEDPFF